MTDSIRMPVRLIITIDENYEFPWDADKPRRYVIVNDTKRDKEAVVVMHPEADIETITQAVRDCLYLLERGECKAS